MANEVEQRRQIDAACNRFEDAWSTEQRPMIASFLDQADPVIRDRLLEALLEVDVELRSKAGLLIEADHYRNLGEQAVAIVQSLIQTPRAKDSVPDIDLTITLAASANGQLEPGQIGPYKLLEKIGEGGMGTVWRAEQSEPVRRLVALKVIRAGLGSREVIVRFEAERQALALMNHSNIARILDVGTTAEGQPYFAMELVEGQPLTTFCDKNRVSISERLLLFAEVCSGVQHAHQKGIVHRDLKPSNILVAMVDGKPVPKVIDFGLAKALESTQRLTDQSLFTGIGQILGTLKYMSPEQASLDGIDIDTRTDIYSLGVILYELLTGSTPLDNEAVRGAAMLKVLQLIRDYEPVRPSSRLGCDMATLSRITDLRRTDSSSLNRILVGDLDWVVVKALEKDRNRRYESVSGLAADIQRFLNNEPVIARPPSAVYRISKFVRKNRSGVAAATLLLTALVAGLAGTTWQMRRAQIAERSAEQARDLAQRNEQSALQQSQLAMSTLTSVIGDIQKGLAHVSGGSEIRRQLLRTSLEKLERVAAEYVSQSVIDHTTSAALKEMGDVILGFGIDLTDTEVSKESAGNDKKPPAVVLARTFYTRAFEISKSLAKADPADPLAMVNLAISFASLGDLSLYSGELQEGIGQYRQSLEILQSLVSLDPSNLMAQRELATMCGRLGEAYLRTGQVQESLDFYQKETDIREALVASVPGETRAQRDLSIAYSNLGGLSLQSGDVPAALSFFQKKHNLALTRAAADPADVQAQRDLAISFEKLGSATLRLGRVDEAFDYWKQGMEIAEKLAEADPEDIQVRHELSISYNNLGVVSLQVGNVKEARGYCQRALEICEGLVEADPSDAPAQRGLMQAYQMMGDVGLREGNVADALGYYRQALVLAESLAAVDSSDADAQRELSSALIDLGNTIVQKGQVPEAIGFFRRALDIRQALAKISPSDARSQRDLGVAINAVANASLALGQVEEALRYYSTTLEISRMLAVKNPTDTEAQRDLSVVLSRMGNMYLRLDESDRAREYYRQATEICESLAPANSSDGRALLDLAIAYEKMGDVALVEMQASEALDFHKKSLELKKRLAAADSFDAIAQRNLSVSYGKVGDVYGSMNDFETAARQYEQAIVILNGLIANDLMVGTATDARSLWQGKLDESHDAGISLGDWESLMQQPVEKLAGMLEFRGIEFAKRSRFVEAAQAAVKLGETEGADCDRLYNAACVFCLCAASIKGADGGELSGEQIEQRQAWINASLVTLKKSIDAGWDDFAHMRQDSDLAILRDLPEFKTLFPDKDRDQD